MYISIVFFFNLGVVRMTESTTASIEIWLIEKYLEKFGLDVGKDVVAAIKDGASVCNRIGQDMESLSFVCQNHGLHLAVLKLLFKKKKATEVEYEEKEGESEEKTIN